MQPTQQSDTSSQVQSQAPTEPAKETVKNAVLLDALPFENGYAWVLTEQGVSLIDKEGSILFTETQKHDLKNLNPVIDGMTYYSIGDTTNVSSSDGGAAQGYSVIRDKNGEVLYSDQEANASDAQTKRHAGIVGYGDGQFIEAVSVSDMNSSGWTIHVIDKSGKELKTPLPYKDTTSDGGPTKFSYWGQGVFGGDEDFTTYDTTANKTYFFNDEPFFDGKLITPFKGGYALELADFEYHDKNDDLLHYYGIVRVARKDIGVSLDDQPRVYYDSKSSYPGTPIADFTPYKVGPDNFFAYDGSVFVGNAKILDKDHGVFLDAKGQQAFTYKTQRPWQVIGADGGYYEIKIEGADNASYVTVIDNKGTQQFAPIKAAFPSDFADFNGTLQEGYFITRIVTDAGESLAIINVKGEEAPLASWLPSEAQVTDVSAFSSGYSLVTITAPGANSATGAPRRAVFVGTDGQVKFGSLNGYESSSDAQPGSSELSAGHPDISGQ